MAEELSVEEYIKQTLRRAVDKKYLEEVTGPSIYGVGNFELYTEDDDEWYVRPVEGWKPPVLLGIVTDYPTITLNHIRDYLKEHDPEILKAIDDRAYITFTAGNNQPFSWDEHIEEWKESWIQANPDYLERMKNKSIEVLFPSTKEEATVSVVEDIPICPDCIQGKCGNCTGTSWNNTKDEETACPCAVKNHPETWIEDEVHTVFHDNIPHSIYGPGQGPSNDSESVEWDIDANLPMYTRDYLKSKTSDPKASEVLFAEVEWLRTAHENSVDKGYVKTYRDGFAAAITWVEFHAKQAKEKE